MSFVILFSFYSISYIYSLSVSTENIRRPLVNTRKLQGFYVFSGGVERGKWYETNESTKLKFTSILVNVDIPELSTFDRYNQTSPRK